MIDVRGVVDTVREPMLLLDTRLRVQSASRAFYKTFRVSPQETEGRRLYDLGNGQWDIPRLRTLLDELLPRNGSLDDFEVEHDFPDIGRKSLLLNARRLRHDDAELVLLAIEDVTGRQQAEARRQALETPPDADDRLSGFCNSLRDMTQWQRSGQVLREIHRRQRAVLESIPVALVLIGAASGRFSYMNQRAIELYGRDYIGIGLDAHLDTVAALRSDGTPFPLDELPVTRSLRGLETVYGQDMLIRRADGELLPVAVSSAPLDDGHGQLDAVVVVFEDISDRRRAEAEAVAAEELARRRLAELEELYQSAPVGLCLFDPDLRYVRINQRLADINGIPVAEHIGKTVRELMPALADRVEPSLREVVATGQPRLDVEIVSETPSLPGVERSFSEQWLPVKDAGGRVTGISVVVEETTKRKQAEKALQEANRRKDAFLATLAHELRNPLAPIRTGLDVLRTLHGEAGACERPLQIMDRQLRHVVRLIDDLLDVSRISRGKIQLRKERIDLAEIIDAVLEMGEGADSRGERRLTVSLPPRPLPLEGDRVRLVQIFSNLLNNAVKFTDAGGRIALRVMPRGDRVEIRVEDDGRGIPRERLETIFDLFAQAEPGHAGGLGIGLTLVRSLVGMHGGTVCAESAGPGQGAVFTVSLPLLRRAPEQPLPGRVTAHGPAPTQSRVLVVDDNTDIVDSLRLLLTALNAEVRVAHDGAEAIGVCEEWQPTHILMDLGMPGMDGYEAARRLTARHPDHAFRLIALTGWGQDDVRQRARAAGFDAHLVKPVGAAALKAIIAD